MHGLSDKQEAEKKPPANELAFWTERLAEPELLKRAVMLDVQANGYAFAVPIGKLRHGGNIEFLRKREAQKAFKLLDGNQGFPNLRVHTLLHRWSRGLRRLYRRKGKPLPVRYYELRWGDPPPFDGCDYLEPICALLLGVHYGYRGDAIAQAVKAYEKCPRHSFDRKTILSLIEIARNRAPRCHGTSRENIAGKKSREYEKNHAAVRETRLPRARPGTR